MKITVEASALNSAYSSIRGAVDLGGNIPILSMVLCEAKDGLLHMTATDLNITASSACPCEGELPQTCIPSYLLAAGAEMSGRDVSISVDGPNVTVSAGRARFTGMTLPADDFPPMTAKLEPAGEVKGSDLARAMAYVTPAISTNDGRYYLHGAAMEVEHGHVIFTATDGHRLHTVQLAASITLPEAIIVPLATLKEVERIGKLAGDGNVSVSRAAGSIAFSSGNDRIVSKLVDGSFPDWRRVVPGKKGVSATVDIAALEKRAKLIERIIASRSAQEGVKPKKGGSAIKLTPDGDNLVITHRNTEADAVAAEFAGEFGGLQMSCTYLRITLAAMAGAGAETVVMDADDDTSPILFLVPNDDSLRAVIMPMRF